MPFSKTAVCAVAAFLSAITLAHPGEVHDHAAIKREIAARNARAAAAQRDLGNCQGSLAARELHQRNLDRRAAAAADLREKRGISTSKFTYTISSDRHLTATEPKKLRRDLATLEEFEAVNHNVTGIYDWDVFTPNSMVFAANTSCILAPEITDGPYYVEGEMIRSNVKESEFSEGVDLWLEVQYIDSETCEPVPNIWVDIWNANATGFYSGIVATDNEVGWNTTFLRGLQMTDLDGIVTFSTIFPGHYEGRAIHTHLLAHTNSTVYVNQTISVGTVSHIGQLFYPDILREDVEALYPYTLNTQAITTNDEDMWAKVQAADGYDPFPEFLYLGDSISDGLMAWIQIGINTSLSLNDNDYFEVAAYRDASGGHSLSSDASSGSGGGAPGGGNGTAPSGASGFVTVSTAAASSA